MVTGYLGEVRTIAFSPDGSLIFSAGDDLEIKQWKIMIIGKCRWLVPGTGSMLFTGDTQLDGSWVQLK